MKENRGTDIKIKLIPMACLFVIGVILCFKIAGSIPRSTRASEEEKVYNAEDPSVLYQLVAQKEEEDKRKQAEKEVALDRINAAKDKMTGSDGNANISTKIMAPADLDISILSEKKEYEAMVDILNSPGEYVGKVIKMSGQYYLYYDEETEDTYPNCVLYDECGCAAGVEFQLKAGEYPKTGTNITIQGKYGLYKEGDDQYYALLDAVILEENTPE